MLPVSSAAVFHLTQEGEITKRYKNRYGHTFYVYDKALGEMRKMTYRVSGRIKDINGVYVKN